MFSGKPPLPKHASIEHAGSPARTTDYRAVIEQADVIYFPEERAGSSGKSEPAALLLEAAQQSGRPFAIAWDSLDATQQDTLEQLQGAAGAAREELIRKLELSGTGRAREHCREVLRQVHARFVALRLPQVVVDKLTAGGALNAEEQGVLATGYKLPSGGYDAYAESRANPGGVGAYRAEVIRRQFAAEAVVRYFRAAGAETKLIVFANSNDFTDDAGVPFYVSQKMNLRQLVLGRERTTPVRGSLLAFFARDLRPGRKVVDGAPGAVHH